MAAEIKDTFDVDPEMKPGAGGIFDVHVDGELIFSKHQVGRFPENDEVLDAIQKIAPD